jgi:hypothetical protein
VPTGNLTNPVVATPLQAPTSSDQLLDIDKLSNFFNPEEGDSIDLDSNTMKWNGKTFDMGNSRIFRSRFERYLLLEEENINDARSYLELLDATAELLSPKHLNPDESIYNANVEEAYRLLFEATEFSKDGGTSRVLAHMIYNSWRLRKEIRADIYDFEQNQKMKQLKEETDANREWINTRRSKLDSDYGRREKEDYNRLRASRENTDQDSLNKDQNFQPQKATELAAQSTSSTLGQEISWGNIQLKAGFAKLQFQSQIVYLLAQRRFQHAIIACSFYRALFKGSSQTMEVGEDVLAQLVPNVDLVYTIEAIEQISNQTIVEVRDSMEAINHALDQDRLVTAMERLQETFFIGEFLAPVSEFPQEKRKSIHEVYQLLRLATDLSDIKDFDRLQKVSDQLYELTNDSKFIQAKSLIQTSMQQSNLLLMQAKLHFTRENFEEGQQALEKASRSWPLNPAISEFSANMNSSIDLAVMMKNTFDELLVSKNYRAIYEQRNELGLGLGDDARRSTALTEILDKVARVDFMLRQADQIYQQGNAYAAWEMVLQAEELLPMDYKVLELKSTIFVEAADYAEILRKAKKAKDAGYYSASFAYYQKALEINPTSLSANQYVADLSDQILSEYAKDSE